MSGVNAQRGIALLESLVALVILALAVLGMLAVQARTLAETQIGVRRGQAVRLIEDLGERIKSNPGGSAELFRYVADWDTLPTAAANCRQTPCNAANLAAWDIANWKRHVADALPLGKARLFAAADGRQLGVIVGWRANERDASLDARLQTDSDCPAGLTCHFAHVEP